MADDVRAELDRLGGGNLRFILNTHFHGDHTHGNTVFGEEATIIAHRNVRERLSTPQVLWGNEHVLGRMRAGLGLGEILVEGLPKAFAVWDWNFITEQRWIETIWKSRSEKG